MLQYESLDGIQLKKTDFWSASWLVIFLASQYFFTNREYHQVSNIRRTLVDNKIVDHSDVVGAAPIGAAPTTSSFST